MNVQVAGYRADLRSKPCTVECPEWNAVIASLRSGAFGTAEDVGPILHSIEWANDYYLLQVDFPSYLVAQRCVDETFADKSLWVRKSIMSTAGMGKFSTDRTIQEYADQIWGLVPARRPHPTENEIAGVTR